jgi:CBS domain-containing protein
VRVSDVMSSPVVTVPPDMRLKEVADLLVRNGISAVPVVDDGELAGLLAREVPGVVEVRFDEE